MQDFQFATAWIDEVDGRKVQILARQGTQDDPENGEVKPELRFSTWLDGIFIDYALGFGGEDAYDKCRRALEMIVNDEEEARLRVANSFNAFFDQTGEHEDIDL